ncbi:MAG TPA: hypothetical protein VEA69_04800 [Tepidisphaeraceae bacterium]|nr:hypothetical protein [Tepidisphaeraceae bacterium]
MPPGGAGGFYGQPADPPIQQDLPCRKCQYNLRGLTASGRCPECGTAVGYSLQGDLLRYCNPSWVDTLKTGTGLAVWGILTIIFGVVMAVAVPMIGQSIGAVQFGLIGGGVVVLIGWILNLIGWFMATQPDPTGMGEERYGAARQLVRISITVQVLATLASLIVLLTAGPFEGGMISIVLNVISNIASAVAIIAQCRYLSMIALRIPDQGASGQAHFLMYALGIVYSLMAAIQLLGLFGGGAVAGGVSRQGAGAIACVGGLVALAMLVFLIMYIILLFRMSSLFGQQSRWARSTWAMSAAPQQH